jgi:hypothetical protein
MLQQSTVMGLLVPNTTNSSRYIVVHDSISIKDCAWIKCFEYLNMFLYLAATHSKPTLIPLLYHTRGWTKENCFHKE